MKKMILLAAGCIFLFACNNEKKEETPAASKDSTAVTSTTEVAPAEIADYKYKDISNGFLAKLQAGDIDGWMDNFADSAVYVWNSGDSLKGKEAISAYWTKRRTDVIDSLKFTNTIWLPVRVNKPQAVEAPGIWALGWYMVDAKYKTGKRMVQWMHMDLHFNSADKIDRAIHYLDRAPINAAVTK